GPGPTWHVAMKQESPGFSPGESSTRMQRLSVGANHEWTTCVEATCRKLGEAGDIVFAAMKARRRASVKGEASAKETGRANERVKRGRAHRAVLTALPAN